MLFELKIINDFMNVALEYPSDSSKIILRSKISNDAQINPKQLENRDRTYGFIVEE